MRNDPQNSRRKKVSAHALGQHARDGTAALDHPGFIGTGAVEPDHGGTVSRRLRKMPAAFKSDVRWSPCSLPRCLARFQQPAADVQRRPAERRSGEASFQICNARWTQRELQLLFCALRAGAVDTDFADSIAADAFLRAAGGAGLLPAGRSRADRDSGARRVIWCCGFSTARGNSDLSRSYRARHKLT